MHYPLQELLTACAALGGVLLIVMICAKGARFTGLSRPPGARRLVIVESLQLDRSRKLSIMSCDGREGLVLIGGAGDHFLGWINPETTDRRDVGALQ